jgi:threonine synthase
VASGKLAQAILHGACIVEVEGSFDDALSRVMEAARTGQVYPLNSINPWRLEGQKTIGYEIAEFLGVPDWVVVPVGNAGNIYAICKGFLELYRLGLLDRLPRLAGVQAEGAAPLARMWRDGLEEPIFVDKPETVATAIRIGRPVNWRKAVRMVKMMRGVVIDVTDGEILAAQKTLARYVGIGAEPAGAAAIAGLGRLVADGFIAGDDVVVCIVTGHALKDPETVMRHVSTSRIVLKPSEVLRYLGIQT